MSCEIWFRKLQTYEVSGIVGEVARLTGVVDGVSPGEHPHVTIRVQRHGGAQSRADADQLGRHGLRLGL